MTQKFLSISQQKEIKQAVIQIRKQGQKSHDYADNGIAALFCLGIAIAAFASAGRSPQTDLFIYMGTVLLAAGFCMQQKLAQKEAENDAVFKQIIIPPQDQKNFCVTDQKKYSRRWVLMFSSMLAGGFMFGATMEKGTGLAGICSDAYLLGGALFLGISLSDAQLICKNRKVLNLNLLKQGAHTIEKM